MVELTPDKYNLLIEPLKKVTINHLFARSVVEKHVTGKVFVDSIQNPKTFYVIHPYGISLLFGDFNNPGFNNNFYNYALNKYNFRTTFEWLQTFPRDWDSVISDLLKNKLIKQADNAGGLEQGIVELNTRVNFKFNKDKYFQTNHDFDNQDYSIIQTGFDEFAGMIGSVIPQYFWNNANDFINNGVGFSLIDNGAIASTAYSAFVHDDKLEIGIETVEQYRGKGYAEKTCAKLIDYCIKRNLDPVWACKLENQPSFKLAQKLGFEPTIMIPFYRLSK
jgi:RimJ/RimL family protein N-acetyltransferase